MSHSRVTWKKAVRLWRLPRAHRLLLVRAGLWLLAVDLGLRVLGFARLRQLLARGVAPASEPVAGADTWGEAETLARWVAVAARHHLYPMRCLTRSLVVWRLLARRGIASELHIGVRKQASELVAHAWVECAGRPVGEDGEVESRYAALALPAP